MFQSRRVEKTPKTKFRDNRKEETLERKKDQKKKDQYRWPDEQSTDMWEHGYHGR